MLAIFGRNLEYVPCVMHKCLFIVVGQGTIYTQKMIYESFVKILLIYDEGKSSLFHIFKEW